jgi:hypothetical protein
VNRLPEVLPETLPETLPKILPETLPPSLPDREDPFAAFASETAQPAPTRPVPATRAWSMPAFPTVALFRIFRVGRRVLIVLLSIALLGIGGYRGFNVVRERWIAAPASGVLTVTSNPSGAEVLIDGTRLGVTPLTTNIGVGFHKLTLQSGNVSRKLSITSRKNVELVQNVELAAPAATTGSLAVTSDPSGLKIAIDGRPRGVTPAVVTELAPGNHVITLTGKGAPMERTVVIAAGATANLMVSKPAEPAATGVGVGSVAVLSEIDVELFEGDTLIGNSRSARLFLPAGSHTLTAVNDALGFRRSFTVDVKPSAAGKVTVPIPNGALSVNAQPWAEVFVDGASLGETPIGNYALPIGSHELVLKHPQLGERRQTVVIAVGRPARIGIDLRK